MTIAITMAGAACITLLAQECAGAWLDYRRKVRRREAERIATEARLTSVIARIAIGRD